MSPQITLLPNTTHFLFRYLMTTFSDLGIKDEIVQGLESLGIVTPTQIQSEVIPLLLEKQGDLISLAQTGTGKTAAFGLPLIQLTDDSNKNTQMLVLCPTRELCVQVARDLQEYAKNIRKINILSIYGGARIEQQMQALRKGAQIIVATPGRLNDLIRRGRVDITHIRYVVFDEADEMLQMGFQDEINAILEQTPAEKNTLLFSATMPREVAAIASKYMTNPAEVTVGKRNAGAENVLHEFYTVHNQNRYAALKRILDNAPGNYSIVFCRTRVETQEIANKLIQDNYNADALHGDLSQAQRDLVMGKFRSKHLQILVATDVAARGLDVNDLTHVVNYNLPDDFSNYTHRSGRTGRAGRKGISVAIINPRERYKIREIEKKIKKKFAQCKVPSGTVICQKQLLNLVDTVTKVEVDSAQIDPLYTEVAELLASYDHEELIKKFLSLEFNQLLKYYRNAPDLNASDRGKGEPERRDGRRKLQARQTDRTQQFTRFFLNVGRRDGIMPQRLIGAINEAPGGGRIKVGKIEIMRNSALIEADSKYIPQVLSAFQAITINGKPVSIEVASKGRAPKAAPKGNPRFLKGNSNTRRK